MYAGSAGVLPDRVVQAAPVMLDKAACTVKAVELIRPRLRSRRS